MGKQIGILGAGGWGTALGILLSSNGHDITLWEYNSELAEQLKRTRENTSFLPGVQIPASIQVTSDLSAAVSGKKALIIVVPSHTVRSVVQQLKPFDLSETLIISGVKGIENKTLKRMTEVIRQEKPELKNEQLIVLSGPSHAEEVSRGIPTAIVAASSDLASARMVQEICMSRVFRVYSSADVTGLELASALKNVIAIAAGIIDGIGMGINTKAALLTRGMVEISRLGKAMGALPTTFSGLGGIGDLIVTCMSGYSRNRYVGEQVGKGKTLSEVLAGMVMVAEGVRTTESAYDLSEQYHIETPIMHQVYEVLFKDKNPKSAITDLMTRQAKEEDWT